ncbi:ABC transporter substrate-binding protein [Gracilimonas sp.]|uniref:ABC transporter substrate-binding protein n=1 Tax=Gracilimonas sp. TaxID=1974203 RepID=UPI003D12C007
MKKFVLLIISVFVFISCGKELETVTVKSDTSELLNAPADSVYTEIDPAQDDFVHIRFGEIAAIESLDPLFASSNSEWRVMNLIYEGLTGLNSSGNISPALAKRWEVNTDSTQFTFHLRTDVYFHDSPAFENGSGRRFVASDVRYAFERMADNDVPDFTANHFGDIRGFVAYHSEQTLVKNPDKRAFNTIEGLKIRNDSTVVFFLNKPSSDFLERLAHPMASIYAKESVPAGNGLIQKAAGTGRFAFIKKEGNAHLLTQNKEYRGFTPKINRLDIVSGLEEKDLYQELARKNLDALIEVGSSTLMSVTDSTGTLLGSFTDTFQLNQTSTYSDYSFFYNQNSGQSASINELISNADLENLLPLSAMGTVTTNMVGAADGAEPDSSRQLVITQTVHPFEVFFLDKLASLATSMDFSFSMNTSFALYDDISLTTRPYPDTEKFLSWKSPVYILSSPAISGISITHEPWNISLVSVKKTGGSE